MGSSFIVIILFFSSLTLLFLSSVAEPVNPHPQEPPSLKIREAHFVKQGRIRWECLYKVRIITANSSQVTSGNATIKYGDAHGNEVYVQVWLQPGPDMTSGYDTTRPCMDRVCYLFLRPDSIYRWTPAMFKVGSNGDILTYTYNGNQPALNNKWYGINQCGCNEDLRCRRQGCRQN